LQKINLIDDHTRVNLSNNQFVPGSILALSFLLFFDEFYLSYRYANLCFQICQCVKKKFVSVFVVLPGLLPFATYKKKKKKKKGKNSLLREGCVIT